MTAASSSRGLRIAPPAPHAAGGCVVIPIAGHPRSRRRRCPGVPLAARRAAVRAPYGRRIFLPRSSSGHQARTAFHAHPRQTVATATFRVTSGAAKPPAAPPLFEPLDPLSGRVRPAKQPAAPAVAIESACTEHREDALLLIVGHQRGRQCPPLRAIAAGPPERADK